MINIEELISYNPEEQPVEVFDNCGTWTTRA